jgi:hypothetical protein
LNADVDDDDDDNDDVLDEIMEFTAGIEGRKQSRPTGRREVNILLTFICKGKAHNALRKHTINRRQHSNKSWKSISLAFWVIQAGFHSSH